MTTDRYTLGDVVRAIEATLRRHPDFTWHGADPAELPNGRFAVDPDTDKVYLSMRLGSCAAFESMIEALAVLCADDDQARCRDRRALAAVLQLRPASGAG